MSTNGQEQGGSERLDRIERALELMLDDHQFREQHKQLLASQVLLTGSLERLSERVDRLTADVTLMRENFDARLKRLE